MQNQALVYEPAVLGDGVFIGPAVVLTNDTYPRAVTTDGRRKGAEDWEAVGVTIEEGASVGARAVCVAPVRIGRWASVGAGLGGDARRARLRARRRFAREADRLGRAAVAYRSSRTTVTGGSARSPERSTWRPTGRLEEAR